MTTRKTVSAKAHTASKAKAPIRRVRNAAAKVETLNVKAAEGPTFLEVATQYAKADVAKEVGGAKLAAMIRSGMEGVSVADLKALFKVWKPKLKDQGKNGVRLATFCDDFYAAYKVAGKTNPKTQWTNLGAFVVEIADKKRDPETGAKLAKKKGASPGGTFGGNVRPDRERMVEALAKALKWTKARGPDLDAQVKVSRQHLEAAYAALGLDPKKV